VETDQKKILIAITFLVLALGVLGFQIFRRIDRDAHSSGEVDYGVMMEEAGPVAVEATVAWQSPSDLDDLLEENPFLRPARARSTSRSTTGSRRGGRAVAGAPVLTGIRTGPNPTVIINDRTRGIGDEIAGWRIVSIERSRVTLRSSDGRTIHLAAR
jgi:hypothetical protein